MESCAVNEMVLAEQLVARTPDHSLTLFDKGFYSLGLLHAWQTTGSERHWLLPLKKGTQYEVVRKLGRQDVLVHLKTSPQARKKWPHLPDTVEARLLTRTIKGKERQVLTSMVDPMRFRVPTSLSSTATAGNRVGLSGDEAQPATTPADPAQQEGCGDTARAVGRAAGV